MHRRIPASAVLIFAASQILAGAPAKAAAPAPQAWLVPKEMRPTFWERLTPFINDASANKRQQALYRLRADLQDWPHTFTETDLTFFRLMKNPDDREATAAADKAWEDCSQFFHRAVRNMHELTMPGTVKGSEIVASIMEQERVNGALKHAEKLAAALAAPPAAPVAMPPPTLSEHFAAILERPRTHTRVEWDADDDGSLYLELGHRGTVATIHYDHRLLNEEGGINNVLGTFFASLNHNGAELFDWRRMASSELQALKDVLQQGGSLFGRASNLHSALMAKIQQAIGHARGLELRGKDKGRTKGHAGAAAGPSQKSRDAKTP